MLRFHEVRDLDALHDLAKEATGSIDVAHSLKMEAYERQLWATIPTEGQSDA